MADQQNEAPARAYLSRFWESYTHHSCQFSYERQHVDDIEFARVDPPVAPEEDSDGSAEWCDDCHAYTHKFECPSKRREAKTTLVDQIVDAVYRSMSMYEDGTWWLDNLKAKACVNRLLATVRQETWEKAIEVAESAFIHGGEVTHRHVEIGDEIVRRLESAAKQESK